MHSSWHLAVRKFIAGASLSGALDIMGIIQRRGSDSFLENIFGDLDKVKGSNNDLLYLAEKVAESDGAKPILYQCCGTEDFLYQDNITFRDHARKLGLDLTYERTGAHEWGYWDKKNKECWNGFLE